MRLTKIPFGSIRARCGRLVCAAVFVSVLACVSFGQIGTPVAYLRDWPSIEAHLKRAISAGTDEEKRDALFEIRNYQSSDASRLALPALSDRNEIIRATATASVVFLPAPEAVRSLVPLLSDRRPFVRKEAAYALEAVGHPGSTDAIISALKRERDLEVIAALLIAMGATGDRMAVEPLLAQLNARPSEETEFIRRSAARSIGRLAQIIKTGNATVTTPHSFLPEQYKNTGLQPTETVSRHPIFSIAAPVLVGVLQDPSESKDTRREAAFALGAIGNTDALGVLKVNANSDDPYLAEISREALSKMLVQK